MKIIFILVVRITRPFHATLKIVPMKKYVLFVLKRLHFSIESIRPLATKVRTPINKHDNPVITKLQSFQITIIFILIVKMTHPFDVTLKILLLQNTYFLF